MINRQTTLTYVTYSLIFLRASFFKFFFLPFAFLGISMFHSTSCHYTPLSLPHSTASFLVALLLFLLHTFPFCICLSVPELQCNQWRSIHVRITKHSLLYIGHADSVRYLTCPQVLALTQFFISNFHTSLVPEYIKVIDERWTDMTVWRLEATSVGIVLFSRNRLLMKTQLVHHSCR